MLHGKRDTVADSSLFLGLTDQTAIHFVKLGFIGNKLGGIEGECLENHVGMPMKNGVFFTETEGNGKGAAGEKQIFGKQKNVISSAEQLCSKKEFMRNILK